MAMFLMGNAHTGGPPRVVFPIAYLFNAAIYFLISYAWVSFVQMVRS